MRLVFYSDHFGRKVKDGFKYKKKKWRGGKTDERERHEMGQIQDNCCRD